LAELATLSIAVKLAALEVAAAGRMENAYDESSVNGRML
jgi:hypothetical protein